MNRQFVYRTVPLHRFPFCISNKNQHNKSNPLCSSLPKYFFRHETQRILVKTKKNILLQTQSNQTIQNYTNESPSHLKNLNRNSKQDFNKLDKEKCLIKFHKVPINDLNWQKWKNPLNIIFQNKKSLTQRSTKPPFAQNDVFSSSEKAILKYHEQKVYKKKAQLGRLKRYLQGKRELIQLTNQIHELQQMQAQKLFANFKLQMQRVCDNAKNKSFEGQYFQQRKNMYNNFN